MLSFDRCPHFITRRQEIIQWRSHCGVGNKSILQINCMSQNFIGTPEAICDKCSTPVAHFTDTIVCIRSCYQCTYNTTKLNLYPSASLTWMKHPVHWPSVNISLICLVFVRSIILLYWIKMSATIFWYTRTKYWIKFWQHRSTELATIENTLNDVTHSTRYNSGCMYLKIIFCSRGIPWQRLYSW